MLFIYNDFAGTHTTVLAAAYHLQKLDPTREPTREEILACHNFNKLAFSDRGKLYFHGIDEDGNKVYTMGRGISTILVPGIYNLIDMLIEEKAINEKIILSDTSPTVPFRMRCGGLLSLWMKIDVLGVPLLVAGARQAYQVIAQLVRHTKNTANTTTSQLVMLENKQFK
ncbi:DUF3189 family protein [Paenibacillus xerothermodurans]|uniref:DUF3189 family protein n=1 Tax=Paenibacillus xerothermodurans TaxID=1977292 RepID=A0A2W1P1G2_PAEXE|nr:DUF3189 family protein [Paenibacillus xerothermodurans]PZE21582.1 DUF3189 family protein [Paenibacillus xerothermodurans]